MNRRSFLKYSAAYTAASAWVPMGLPMDKRINQYGVQLYTVREEMAADPGNTLLRLREMGYHYLEHAGYDEGQFYGQSAENFRDLCYGRGLRIISGHVSTGFTQPGKMRTMVRNWEAVLDDMKEVDQDYIVLAWLDPIERKTIDDYKRIADLLNDCGEQARQRGMQMAYHNHDFEFQELDGQIPYDILLNQTEEKLVTMELDLYWIYKAGADPLTYFDKFPGRFELWHVKDMDNTAEQFFTEVGTGVIDWQALFEASKKAGMKRFFVEQDQTRVHDPLRSLQISQTYLSNLRY